MYCVVAEAKQALDGLVDANREFAIEYLMWGDSQDPQGTKEVISCADVTDLFSTALQD